jgi:hypothetical protein
MRLALCLYSKIGYGVYTLQHNIDLCALLNIRQADKCVITVDFYRDMHLMILGL